MRRKSIRSKVMGPDAAYSGAEGSRTRTSEGFGGILSGNLRPAVFALPFWTALLAAYAKRAFDFFGEGGPFGLPVVTLSAVALAAAWTVLPWETNARPLRKLAVPVFLAAIFVFSQLTGSDWALVLYLIAFANAVFAFGTRRGIVCAVAMALVVCADIVLSQAQGIGLREAALSSFALVPLVLLAMGASAAILAAVRGREEARTLLLELEKAHAELAEYAGRLRASTISEERTRLSREIHDTLGHHLTAAKLQLEHASRSRNRDPEGAWREVEETRDLILATLADVRRSVRALKPLALEESVGAGAFASLVRSFKGTGPEIFFGTEGDERGLPPEEELILYRAMQEGLTNALKHSGARRIRATLSFEAKSARVTVADNGRGASPGAVQKGFGLSALAERAGALGGKLTVGDTGNAENGGADWVGEGFVLEVEVPVPPRTATPGASS